ncbi:Pentatricopeptide repeat [Parasponia andersonii]|uniref:Pentatricopeptide repeat n=1 Tax=Parasponia andersonii TaxID=3476 RepID=A0A2P5D4R4_PARAD|nr:Pentatricopeptide repeat [Parasponia andersonii]
MICYSPFLASTKKINSPPKSFLSRLYPIPVTPTTPFDSYHSSLISTNSDWNTVVRGYSKSRNPNWSMSVFIGMLRDGVSPDHLTYHFLAKAAACPHFQT